MQLTAANAVLRLPADPNLAGVLPPAAVVNPAPSAKPAPAPVRRETPAGPESAAAVFGLVPARQRQAPVLPGATAPVAPVASDRAGGLPYIERAVAVTDAALQKVMTEVRPGMTEKQVQKMIDDFFRAQGYGLSFPTISVSGPNTKEIHGVPSDRVIQANDIIMCDIGARYEGPEGQWCSDVTRTFFVGQPTPRQKEIWEFVHEAQRRALALVKPGASTSAIDAAARDYIRSKGFSIPHAVGHGVGNKVHEPPIIGQGFGTRLRVGDVITVEPGIYSDADGFGVRVEDTLVVTETGYRLLSKAPYSR